jgi:hypothetical protein
MKDADHWMVHASQLPDSQKPGDRRVFTTHIHP